MLLAKATLHHAAWTLPLAPSARSRLGTSQLSNRSLSPVLPHKPHVPPRGKLGMAVDLHEVVLARVHARVEGTPQCRPLGERAVDANELHVVHKAERQVSCRACRHHLRGPGHLGQADDRKRQALCYKRHLQLQPGSTVPQCW